MIFVHNANVTANARKTITELINNQFINSTPKTLKQFKFHTYSFLYHHSAESSFFMPMSFFTSLIFSLKLRTPFPSPPINSGIFLPPKNNRSISAIKIISYVPIPNIILFYKSILFITSLTQF